MRLFFALPLPEPLQEEAARFQVRAREAGLSASWPDSRGLHLTLAFLGEVEAARLPLLSAVAQECARRHDPFPLRTAALGGFPKAGAARVLWLGLESQPALDALVADLRHALAKAGVPFDEKPFRAHLTLARPRTPLDIARTGPGPAPFVFEARELVLYESVQARYRPVGIHPLG